MISKQSVCNIGAILGLGRSGTTWLGAIVASHPKILYRFEPFHRLQKTQPAIKEMYDLIMSDNISPEDVPRIYQCLLPAYPESEKPPFFTKDFSSRLSFGKSFFWPLARKNAFLSPVFRSLYTPKEKPFLIFKEVDYSDMVVTFLNKTEIPVVYIIRHPCAVTSSIVRGQKDALMPMPEDRLVVLKRVLPKHAPKLAEIYEHKLEELTTIEQEALYWVVQTGRALRACEQSPNGLVVIYEDLTERPVEIAKQVFQHFNLTMPEEAIAFIEESSNKSLKSAIKRGQVNMNKYFTIFRDRKVARDRWKEEMSPEDQMRVMEIVKDSPEFSFGVEKGFWS